MSSVQLRCRKCRTSLNENCKDCIISSHNVPINTDNIRNTEGKCSQHTADVLFIKETSMPKWINDSVNEANWCKGKLVCPNCSARLGSFDFVSSTKCICDNFVLPSVHIVKSKVDYNSF